MAKIAIYGDPHITKKLPQISEHWDESVVNTFRNMYQVFKDNKVDKAVCLGDLFDSSILEASSVKKVKDVLSIMNESGFMTHILLGNHEMFGSMDNILEFIEYDNIETELVLESYEDEGLLFIPYSHPVEETDPDTWKDKIVFTHHDIYGAELAGGRVKATFGIDPNVFEGAKMVINGHIHNRSKVGKVFNAGSLFSTQFGELSERLRDKPQFYILDTETLEMTSYDNEDSIMFITVDAKTVKKDLSKYKNNKKVVRVLYSNEEDLDKESLEKDETIIKIVYRKSLSGELTTLDAEMKKAGFIDLKVFLVKLIDKDDSLLPEDKTRIIELSNAVLAEGGTDQ